MTPVAIVISAFLFPSIRLWSTAALNAGIFGLMVASTGAGVSLFSYALLESEGPALAFVAFVTLLGISLLYLVVCGCVSVIIPFVVTDYECNVSYFIL